MTLYNAKGDKLLPDPRAFCCLLLTFFSPVLRRENSQTEVSPALPSSPSIAARCFCCFQQIRTGVFIWVSGSSDAQIRQIGSRHKHTHSDTLWIVKPLSLPCWLTLPAIILFTSSAAQNDRNVSKVRPVINFTNLRMYVEEFLPFIRSHFHTYFYFFWWWLAVYAFVGSLCIFKSISRRQATQQPAAQDILVAHRLKVFCNLHMICTLDFFF